MKTPSFPFVLVAALTVGPACDPSAGPSNDADDDTRVVLGKADGVPSGSCADSCGEQSANGACWCDDLCLEYGDCCADKAPVCDAPSTEVQDAMLLLANTASQRFLVDEVGLPASLAAAIVDHRAGPDGEEITGDDTPFVELAELETIEGMDSEHRLAIESLAFPLPDYTEFLPDSFSVSFDVRRCTSHVPCTPEEEGATSVQFSLVEGGTRLSFSGMSGSANIGDSGSFWHSRTTDTCGERSCSHLEQQIAGELSPFGTLTLTSFSRRSNSGNQALGFTHNRMSLNGQFRVSVYSRRE